MNFDYSEKLVFWAEWFQEEANVTRSFYLYFFPSDNTIEIFDHTTKKLFLRRTTVKGFTEASFYVGAKLNILGRQIKVLDYADTPTKERLMHSQERTFCLLKPGAIPIMDKILKRLNEFNIKNCRMVRLSAANAIQFYENKAGDSMLPFLMEHLISGPVLGMELVGVKAMQMLLDIAGPENPAVARQQAPNSVRAIFGQDVINNIIHCSDTSQQAEKDIRFFFNSDQRLENTAQFKNTSLCIVKPHAVKEGKFADICAALYEGNMTITAIKSIFLERPNCEEFYEVYKGVVPEYIQMVLELADGPCVALEVKSMIPDANTYLELRKLCGSVDTELAKQLRPSTIRARFGVNKIQNAVHCTDLEEDTTIEVEYFFKIM